MVKRTSLLPDDASVPRPARAWASWSEAMIPLKLIGRMFRDEKGGEVLEYALIAGLIVVAAVAAISAVGGKVLASWTSAQNSI